jgi:hypothetical protein
MISAFERAKTVHALGYIVTIFFQNFSEFTARIFSEIVVSKRLSKACRLKAEISESELKFIARQRLSNNLSCIIVWVTIKHVHVTTLI